MTADQANAVFDVLVEVAGAGEWQRDEFVLLHTEGRCDEFRFQGSLGFGGKFWRHGWRVTAYPEDVKARPDRQAVIDATNERLAELFATAGVPPEGCHYCGVERRDHGRRWTAGVSWHAWVEPTKEQIAERLRARLEARSQ